MTTKKDAAGPLFSQDFSGAAKPLPVSLDAAGPRRAKPTIGAKGQVKAQHGKAGSSEGLGHFDEELRLAIPAGTVGQRNGVAIRFRWRVKKTANGRIGGGVVERREHTETLAECRSEENGGHSHRARHLA